LCLKNVPKKTAKERGGEKSRKKTQLLRLEEMGVAPHSDQLKKGMIRRGTQKKKRGGAGIFARGREIPYILWGSKEKTRLAGRSTSAFREEKPTDAGKKKQAPTEATCDSNGRRHSSLKLKQQEDYSKNAGRRDHRGKKSIRSLILFGKVFFKLENQRGIISSILGALKECLINSSGGKGRKTSKRPWLKKWLPGLFIGVTFRKGK